MLQMSWQGKSEITWQHSRTGVRSFWSGTVDSEEVHRTPLTPSWERRIWWIRPVQRFDCCCRVAVIQLSRKIQPRPTVPEMGRSARIESRLQSRFSPSLAALQPPAHIIETEWASLLTNRFVFLPSKQKGRAITGSAFFYGWNFGFGWISGQFLAVPRTFWKQFLRKYKIMYFIPILDTVTILSYFPNSPKWNICTNRLICLILSSKWPKIHINPLYL